MNKLCYILPEYDSRAHTHFAYLPDFIRELSRFFDVFLIIEKGEKPADDWGCRRVQLARFRFLPLRICELHCRLLFARLAGYKDFYVHYSFLAAFLASLITKALGGRVFYWNCGLPWNYGKNFLREKFERLVYKIIDFLVTGTEGMKKMYAEHYGLPLEKIKVMPNWVNLKNFQFPISNFQKEETKKKLGIKPDQKAILFIHRLSKRKGAHYLPEIAGRLEALIPNSKFVILAVGDGPERENLESEIKNRKLENCFKLPGWIPNEELAAYYSLADVFIMPSDEEGFPRVLLEAMAYGVPLVAFDAGGVKEIVPPELRGFVVSAGDVAAFAARVAETLEKDSADIRAAEQEWIKRFDLPAAVQKFKTLFL